VGALGAVTEPWSLLLEYVQGGDLHQLFEAQEQFSNELKVS